MDDMNEPKFTPAPWSWGGEDYRFGWGWQILVGPSGEGLIVGQDSGGGPCKELRSFEPVPPALCITGIEAEGKPHVEPVHVFSEANGHLIRQSPQLYNALHLCVARGHHNTCSFSLSTESMCDCGHDAGVVALAAARGEPL